MPKYSVTVAVTVECNAKDADTACKSAESLVREDVRTPAKVEWISCDTVSGRVSSAR